MDDSKIQTVIVKYSLLYGLASFIPIPLLDEYAQELLFRRMLKRMCEHYGYPISQPHLKYLSRKSGGCCSGCILGVLLWPIKKFIKTVAFFLSFKSLSDEVASCCIQALAYQEVLKLGWNSQEKEKILHLRRVVKQIASEQSASFVTILLAILETSKRGIRALLWGLWRRIRSNTEAEIDTAIVTPLYEAIFANEENQQKIRLQLSEKLSLTMPTEPSSGQVESVEDVSEEPKEQNLSQINSEKDEE
ncbi:MAG: hypothetical protein VX278_10755 [Myxococcota bacterium]|nr:hypothetical protein [Myxococcota bacterium]